MMVISLKLKPLSYLVAKRGLCSMEMWVLQVEGYVTSPSFMSFGKSEKFIASMNTDSSALTGKASETCDMTITCQLRSQEKSKQILNRYRFFYAEEDYGTKE